MLQRALKNQCVAKPDELKQYLDAPPAESETDVLQWWKAHAAVYPCLAAMARDYLAIPATSAPVERVFSAGTRLSRSSCGPHLSTEHFRNRMRLGECLQLPR